MSRPYANVFFGMPLNEDDYLDCDYELEEKLEQDFDILVIKTGSEDAESYAFAIKESSQEEDWDSCFAVRQPQPEAEGEELARLHDRIKSACNACNVEYNRDAVKWYMSAYLS